MKKNKLLVILSLALTLSCLLSALSMNVVAEMPRYTHYVTNQEYTSVTQTYGYSYVAFTGNYYPDEDGTNNAILAAEVGGGRRDQFTTTLSASIGSIESIYKDSDTEGRSTLSATIIGEENDIITGASGRSEQGCTNKNNTADSWRRFYSARWSGYSTGWVGYSEVS